MWALAQKHIAVLSDPNLEWWLLKIKEKSGKRES